MNRPELSRENKAVPVHLREAFAAVDVADDSYTRERRAEDSMTGPARTRSSLLREWRIGWSQGALMRAVRTLDRIDPGWQQRRRTLQMLGLAKPGKCDATAVV